jgi:hypothetical protein
MKALKLLAKQAMKMKDHIEEPSILRLNDNINNLYINVAELKRELINILWVD